MILRNHTTAWILMGIGIVVNACGIPQQDAGRSAGAVKHLKLQPGFHAEHLYSPFESGTGSWVSMTFDDKGRMIASDQYGSLYRLELPPIGSGSDPSAVKVEKLYFDIGQAEGVSGDTGKVQMGYAHGLIWAFNSLYAMVNHKGDSHFEKSSGFYRLQDTDGDDQFDKVTLLTSLVGEQEHGPHSVKLAPDGNSFYVVCGNNTKLPDQVNHFRTPPVWQRDNILPPLGKIDLRTSNYGAWIAKVDSTGKKWDIIAAGLRNPFDLAFNDQGDLFTYDSDMEWDIGMSWYRPTRICHVTSGAEFGWRDGNGKWSPAYPDNLPPILNIGQGSPTNVVALSDARFPEKYSQALLAFDWSFGIIYAIHLKPQGASYSAEAEEFISGAPFPVADGVIGPDGALYILTGGRRLSSDLYRVYYEQGDHPRISEKATPAAADPLAETRRKIERFHLGPDAAALDFCWPYLRHEDRFIRYAARIAVEQQPLQQWQEKALRENDPVIATQALLALARHATPAHKSRLFARLTAIEFEKLSVEQQQDLLRTIEVALARLGKPHPDQNRLLISYLSGRYPAADNELNRSFSKILAFIGAPSLVEKTLGIINEAKDDTTEQKTVVRSSDLILRNPQYGMDIAGVLSSTPPAQQIYYAIILSEAGNGWTTERREKYFRWFHQAYGYRGGRHYLDYINAARKSALQQVPAGQRNFYDSLSSNTQSEKEVIDWVKIMSDGGPGRQWTLQEAVDSVGELSGRDFTQGKNMFAGAACITCHTMQGEGGAIGPDLTQLGTRFSTRDILEAIIDPNKEVSDQYASTQFTLKDGTTVLGQLIKEEDGKYYISQNPFDPETLRELDKESVLSFKTADISLMPPLLINNLSPDRLRDLMAYLISGGNENHPVFKKD